MTIPTPSSLGRVAACIVSEALPHAGRITEWSEDGTVFAAFVHNANMLGRAAALERVPEEHRDAMEAVPVDQLPAGTPGAYASEVAFALDLATGQCRELGRGLTREQAHALARPGEMVGITDLVGLAGDVVVILDYKRTWRRLRLAEVEWQTKTYAVMAALAYGKEGARHGALRVPEGGEPSWRMFPEMDGLDIQVHLAELRALMRRREEVLAMPAEERPAPVEGSHCTYCPAQLHCPQVRAHVQMALAGETEATVLGAARPLDVTALGRAWRNLERLGDVAARMKAVVLGLARQQPIDLGGGYELGEVPAKKEEIVPALALPALVAIHGEALGNALHAASVKTKTSITKEAFKAAARSMLAGPDDKVTHVENAALQALRDRGAMHVYHYTKVTEHKRAAPKKAAPTENPTALPPAADGATRPDLVGGHQVGAAISQEEHQHG